MQDQKKHSYITIFSVAFMLLVLIGVLGRCNSENIKQSETNAFNFQLHKDPSTWTNQEKDRYNDFIEWSDTHK